MSWHVTEADVETGPGGMVPSEECHLPTPLSLSLSLCLEE
jgi:hypothetical protein